MQCLEEHIFPRQFGYLEQENWIKKYGKGRWTEDEIEASALYFTEEYELPCIFAGIDVKKIKLKKIG